MPLSERGASPRNLFRYPLWLTPRALFLVLRHEPVYATLIPMWLKAYGLLTDDVYVYGILHTAPKLAASLLCEVQDPSRGSWAKAGHIGERIDCCGQDDFPGAVEAMPLLNQWIETQPHVGYTELGDLSQSFDAETYAALREQNRAKR